MISIRTNSDSINAQQNLNINHSFQSKTIQQLTSGFRINSSADDAAGLAIANSYRSKIAELNQGVSNANDGVSQLQIVDGGLSNISTILDRMKTLATQSASATFTGNRSVLNQEYTGLLSEINRQATNVNLNAGGTFNSALSVYIGGANSASTATIGIDLSGAHNAVDSTSLGLSTSSVSGGGTGIAGNTLNLNTPNTTYVKGSSHAADQTFSFNLVDPTTGSAKTVQATVAATANGSSLQDVLTSLNKQLSPLGISAGTDANGAIQFGGSTAFTVSDNATVAPPAGGTVTATSTGANLLTNQSTAAGNGIAENTSNYLVDGKSAYVPPAASGSETLSFTTSSGAKLSVNLTNASTGTSAGDTLAHALSSINSATSSYGIYAVANAAGTGINFQSNSTFSVDSTKSLGAVTAAVPAPVAAASFAGNTTNLNASTTYLANASQSFTFNVATAAGASQSVTVALAGGANGLTSSQVVTGLNTAIASKLSTNPALGTITASLDSNNKLVFTGGASNTSFSVNAASAIVTPGSPSGTTTNAVLNGATTGANNLANHAADYLYAAGAQTIVLNDGTGTTGQNNLTVAAGLTVAAAIQSINTQLTTLGSTTKAVLSSATGGSTISFQNATDVLAVGQSTNTAAATAPITQVAFSTASTDLSVGTGLLLGSAVGTSATQVFTFNTATGSQNVTITGTDSGGAGISGATVLTQLNSGLTGTGITASLDSTTHHLTFTGQTTPFTVSVATAVGAASGQIFSAASTATDTNIYNKTQAVGSGAAVNFVVDDGAAVNLSLTAAQNAAGSVPTIVSALNAQLIAANSTIRAVADTVANSVSFQSVNNFTVGTATGAAGGAAASNATATSAGFGATNTTALQSGPFLTGGSQTFTFNVAKADGTTSQVAVSLSGGVNGLNAGDVISSLNAAITAKSGTNPELGTITAALDSNNKLTFTGGASNTAFTVTSAAATATTAGAAPVGIAGAGTAENTGDHVVDLTYTAGSQTIKVNDGTVNAGSNVTGVSVAIATGLSLNQAIASANSQLLTANSSTKAVASADGTSISFQNATNTLSINGTAATAAGAATTSGANLTTGGPFLAGSGTENFTFNTTTTSGANDSVTLQLVGTGPGINAATIISQLQGLINTSATAHPALANIVVGQDSTTGKITFTDAPGTTTAFNVVAGAPSTGTGVVATATSIDNTTLNNYAQTYAGAGSALSYVVNDGTAVKLSVAGPQNTGIPAAVTLLNQQLQAAGSSVVAIQSSNGTGISFQSSKSFIVGGSASNPTTTTPASFGTANTVQIQSGPFLAGSGTQAFNFNVVDPTSKSSTAYSISIAGGANGLTSSSAVLAAVNSALATAVAGTPASGSTAAVPAAPGLAGISASLDTNGHIVFTGGASQAFTVQAGVASAGTGLLSNPAAVSSDNSALNTLDQKYAVSTTAQTIGFTAGGATTAVNIAANSTIDSQINQTNTQLAAAGINNLQAVKSSDGTSISYQSSAAFSVGTPQASGVFSGTAVTGTVNASVAPAAAESGLTNAESAINAVNSAIKALGLVQGSIGAGENKLQYAINLAQSQISNFSSAESQIRDTDVAQQAANLTKSQVLTQTSIAAMAQANQEPQSVLKLLQ